jgi:hypothetical protein
VFSDHEMRIIEGALIAAVPIALAVLLLSIWIS